MKTTKKISHSILLLLVLTLAATGFLAMPSGVFGAACGISAPGTYSWDAEKDGFNLVLTATGADFPNTFFTWTFTWDAEQVPGIDGPNKIGVKNFQVTFTGTPAPASEGTYKLLVTVEDTGQNKCSVGSATVIVTINPKPEAPVIDTNSLPSGQVGSAYYALMAAHQDTLAEPWTWTQAGLPAGINIDPDTGAITGTPPVGTPAGAYSVDITVKDANGLSSTRNYTLTLAPGPTPLGIATLSAPDGQENIPYSYNMTGVGGAPPYSWSAAGVIPPGLTMEATGLLHGTPTTAGNFAMTVTITDSAGDSVTRPYPVTISAAPAIVLTNMSNYCITPPFIKPEILPNVLLMIDNSASMYDLAYVDLGVTDIREAVYCYDRTFSSAKVYPGYFKEGSIYEYSDANNRFEVVAGFPGACDKQVPSHLCIKGTNLTPKAVTAFYASGKYLNWLTASKFDIEKQVLTGGKYDAGFGSLIAESRGCVGRRFIKEAQTGNYVEGVDSPLDITFGVRGPIEPTNPSAPSSGGLTEIDIFAGNYDEGVCRTAISLYQDGSCDQHCRRNATAACLEYSPSSSQAGKTSNIFIQSVQECFQYDEQVLAGNPNPTVGTDALNIKNFCPEIFDFYPGNCNITTTQNCTVDGDCPGGQLCLKGPRAIQSGNAALLCSSSYTGACYVGAAPYDKLHYTGTVDGESGDDCIIYMHNKYCGDVKRPPVTDPTDDPSATELFANVPAIMGDIGLMSQLGNPLKTLYVRVQSSAPEGNLQKFKDRIRFGAQSFNFVGSYDELNQSGSCVDDDIVKCPRVCSIDKTKICASFQDCPSGQTCELVTAANRYRDPVTGDLLSNLDSARIIAHIGDPIYASNPVGDHNSGLIRAVNDIRAQTWTPFAEGMYNAVAYFTQNIDTSDTTRPHRLNTDNFDETKPNPVVSNCQKNNILLITDGMSTTDQNRTVIDFVTVNKDADTEQTLAPSASGSVAPKYFGSKNIDDIAWYGQHKNIFNPAIPQAKPKDSIKTYTVYTGVPCDPSTVLNDCTSCTSTDENQPEQLMRETAKNGGGVCAFAKDPPTLNAAIATIFESISGAAASGTAASVLASGEGSGANLIQAVFYPFRQFDGTSNARWIGRLTNLWYYVDPRFGASGIYEDNGATQYVLDLRNDYKVSLYYDAPNQQTKAHRVKDTNGDGVTDTPVTPDINFELLSSLWDAGAKLWQRDPVITPRKIWTTTAPQTLIEFTDANATALKRYLQTNDDAVAAKIINYTRGTDFPGSYRGRTVTIGSLTTDAGTHTGVWKLGDVIQSTPRIATRFPLNTYDQTYGDSTYKTYISSEDYKKRGLVFVGANDGMLHAFHLGKLLLDNVTGDSWKDSVQKKAKLADPAGLDRGKEMWAFIPKNVLPYLKYMTETSYCHIYSVDLTPMVFDAAIGLPADGDISNDAKTAASWRTILIGGMRLGGGCRNSSDATCPTCVKAPGVDINGSGFIDTDEERAVGISSYFALDVTNTLNNPANPPQLLWEYSTEELGLTTSGPSVVKINMKSGDVDGNSIYNGEDPSDTGKNGKYFVVFASGPTGQISTTDHQFTGESAQDLRIYVLDLKTGLPAMAAPLNTGITEAFGGNIFNTTMDTDLDYQDDVIYVPYVRKCGVTDVLDPCESGTWTDGGVGRLLTHEDTDPAHWTWSKLIDGTGPVTAAAGKLVNKITGKLWVYFGTGRYFFEKDPADDAAGQRRVYGIRDPCYSTAGFAPPCPNVSGLENVTNINDVPTDATDIDAMTGWYINLLGPGGGYRAERVITDPLASITGLVLFTTFQPRDNACEPGGRSFIWATRYDTGGAPGALLKGKGLLQVSTGTIEEVDLASQFTEEGERKTPAMEGVPPTAQGLSILSSPPPVKRTIHVKER